MDYPDYPDYPEITRKYLEITPTVSKNYPTLRSPGSIMPQLSRNYQNFAHVLSMNYSEVTRNYLGIIQKLFRNYL